MKKPYALAWSRFGVTIRPSIRGRSSRVKPTAWLPRRIVVRIVVAANPQRSTPRTSIVHAAEGPARQTPAPGRSRAPRESAADPTASLVPRRAPHGVWGTAARSGAGRGPPPPGCVSGVTRDAVPAGPLGFVQGRIGLAQQVLRREGPGRIGARHADAQRDDLRGVRTFVRDPEPPHLRACLFGDAERALAIRRGQHEDELLA